MSVDSTTLERSALERKDREELTTIATALGAKPPSRARKAEIVQMILELTGVAAPGSAPPPAPSRQGGDDPGTAGDDADAAGDDAAPAADVATPAPAPSAGSAGSEAVAPVAADAPRPVAVAEAPAQQPLGWDAAEPAPTAAEAASSSDARPTAGNGTGTGGRRGNGRPTAASTAVAPAASATGSPTGGAPGGPAGSYGTPGAPAAPGGSSAGAPSGTAEAAAGSEAASSAPAGQGDQPSGRADRPERGDRGDQPQGGRPERTEQVNGQQGDDGEQGNRRRRRRGRRGGNEPQQGGQGGPSDDFAGEPVEVSGLLDLRDEGYGFLRVRGFLPSKDDIYVSVKQARQFGLRKGDHIVGASRPALRNEKNPALLRIDQVNGQSPDAARRRRRFEDLTPLFPDIKLRLETPGVGDMTARIVDLISPIGKGQRGLIVSPPKAGKTTVMKQVARSIEANNPEVRLIVLLVDERPEEVTDMRRSLSSDASEVVASTFDRPAEEHTQVAELTIERAKRLVEDGLDVCIILDGITRLARAYNQSAPATGRIMSGGVDSGALYPPKKFFGAARNLEEGGSLTILATALVETGSKMDEVIFEEFKGTGNMELRLDRRLSERRIYPAIDVDASSTRHEELLFKPGQLQAVWGLRRVLSGMSSSDGGNAAALDLLMDRMKTFRTNDEFLAEVAKNRLAAG
jgi:transcription termination factor Rho